MPDERACDVGVARGVGRFYHGPPPCHQVVHGKDRSRVPECEDAVAVVAAFPVDLLALQEGERDTVLLVDEVGPPGDLGARFRQEDRVLAGVQRGVGHHRVVRGTAVLTPVDRVGYDARMEQVALAQIVHIGGEGPVGGLLVLHYPIAAEPVVLQGEIQFREYVLGGQYVEVVRFLLGVREEGPGVGEDGVGSLRVVERKGVP